MGYVLSGQKWPSSGGQEVVLTWSFADFNFPAHRSGYPVWDSAIGEGFRNLVRQAFAAWDKVSGIKFVEALDSLDSDIRIGNDYIDGGGSVLGLAHTVYSGSTLIESWIRLDTDAYANDRFYGTVAHEIGHALGLSHSPDQADMMFSANWGQTALTADDIAGIVALYGPDPIGGQIPGIMGTSASEVINGTAGADTIYAGEGHDTVYGMAGNDVIFGGQGAFNDSLSGGDGADQIYAGDGNDNVSGGIGNDIVGGGTGSDTLAGDDGDDAIYGGGGVFADFISGGAGNDVIYAGQGADRVDGGSGNDTIGAGPGADFVTGGTGNDVIYLGLNDGAADVFKAVANNGADTIYAFENGTDRIDISALNLSEILRSPSGANDVLITLPSGGSLLLVGVSSADIDASDFIWSVA